MGALAVHRQISPVTQAAIRPHIEMTLDIAGHIAPEIALDLVALVHDLANLDHIVVAQIIGLEIQRNTGLTENLPRRAAPDAVNIGQRDFHPFAFRQIYPCDTCHSVTPLRISKKTSVSSSFERLNF